MTDESDDRELVRLADQILADIRFDASDALTLRSRIVGALIYVRQEASRAWLGSALTRGAAMTEPDVHIITDRWGSYEVPAESILATAPRRRDGWWDRRTLQGRAAIAEFSRNQKLRREIIERGGGDD